jgi:hypothetical protein
MKLIIDLPDEFEQHFDFDKFQDSFMRICGDIRTEGCLCGNYEYELADELKKAFDKAEKFKEEE